MAGNKFASRLTVILFYAVLEWILIILLLLNSLFSYLITKFATYFGLKKPCLWCSRVDHVLEPGKTSNSCRDLVCEAHATEISNLGYCLNHQKLAESHSMCLDCLASRPNHKDESSVGPKRTVAFISWVSKDAVENGEMNLRCCCCNESLSSNVFPPSYSLFKPSWGALRYTEKGNLVIEAISSDDSKEFSKLHNLACYTEEDRNEIECNAADEHSYEEGVGDEHQTLSDVGSFGLKDAAEEDCSRSESNLQFDEKEANEHHKGDITEQKGSLGIDFDHRSFDDRMTQCYCESDRLMPVELIDSSTVTNHESCELLEECQGNEDHQNGDSDSTLEIEEQADVTEEEAVVVEQNKANQNDADMDDSKKQQHERTEDSLLDDAEQQEVYLLEAHPLSIAAVIEETDDLPAKRAHQEKEMNDFTLSDDQTACDTLNEPSVRAINEPPDQVSIPLPCMEEDHPSANAKISEEISNIPEADAAPSKLGENNRDATIPEDNSANKNKNLSVCLESNEPEEEKSPETPNSIDSVHYLHKKHLLFEKRESGTEESLDGSVVSEMDGGDPVLSVERLKTALKAEQKALNALYAELEAERNASAIAANQTMAMINRLQEEKAAMQMEALQYQRMMEEQAEYDQEALQLLNELMIKREKEKQELEKELEVYRKKVFEYEAKEKVRMLRRMKDGSVISRNSSITCSNAEDIDELSIDLNREVREEEGSVSGNHESSNNDTQDEVINLQEIALDCVKQMSSLDDSLAEFEEERLSILDQLKALEEKLITLGDKEFNEDEHSVENECYQLSTPEENELSKEFSKDESCLERKSMGSMAKSLLPLLDAADNETDGSLAFDQEFVEMENSSVDSKKLAIEEEVDHVYERLQALEADKEFLKHCVSSIQKGDKGMDLLEEILQHLRDLRSVDLRVRNLSDDAMG